MQAILQNPFLKYLYGFLPKRNTLILATVCFAIGMFFGYGTISFVNGDPSQLEQSWQDQWVRGAEARFRKPNTPLDDNDANIVQLLAAVDNPLEVVQRLSLGDPEFVALAEQAQLNAANATQANIINTFVMPVVWIVLFAIVYALLFFLWAFILWPYVRDIIRSRQPRTMDDEAAAAEVKRLQERRALEQQMKQETASVSVSQRFGEPIIRKVSIYQAGFGNYDDSFNIETDAGMYYGEAGGSIAERVGDGVAAIEVWMFDKDEFANTPTVVLASEYAFNNEGVKSHLKDKGDVVLAKEGELAVLESNALYVEAKIVGVEYDANAPTPNSVFNKLTIQITAWAKGANAGGGSTLPPTQTTPSPLPPAMPSPQPYAPLPSNPPATPPSSGGGFAPPPSFNNPPPPDDPFGGTGDFTPVNPNR